MRSNKLFQENGRKKLIAYAICTSNTNPDHKLRYPNECDPKNTNRINDIKKRINHECDLYQAVRKTRELKRTGNRRLQA